MIVASNIAPDPTPGEREDVDAHAARLTTELIAQGVRGVILSWVDTAGINRVKTVPVAKLGRAARWGVGMSPVFDTFLADDSVVTTEVLGGPDGDLRLVPDLDRLVALAAQPGWAWAPVNRFTQEGQPHPACTRTLLRHLVSEAAGSGTTFRVGIEVEWAVGRADVPLPDFAPACTGPGYGMTRIVELSSYTADLLAALTAEGIGVEQLHPEAAAGQFEVSTEALDPVAAADTSLLVRETIRAVSVAHDLRASFSPCVEAGGVGNGGHVHVSIWRNGRNLHADGSGRYGLTPAAESFAAGILDGLPALGAISVPSPASFLRQKPSHWAGIFQCWGRETREAALRLITGMVGDRSGAANLEVKYADLAANPYLLLAGILALGLDGIDRELTLPDEITGDPARFDDEERAAHGIRPLPSSMQETVAAFMNSSVLTRALGPVLSDAVVAVRRGEAARMAGSDPAHIAAAYRWAY
jgi:glutamine synthetase